MSNFICYYSSMLFLFLPSCWFVVLLFWGDSDTKFTLSSSPIFMAGHDQNISFYFFSAVMRWVTRTSERSPSHCSFLSVRLLPSPFFMAGLNQNNGTLNSEPPSPCVFFFRLQSSTLKVTKEIHIIHFISLHHVTF